MIELDNGKRYSFLWCGKKKRRDAGVGILIRSERGITFSEPDFNDSRVMALNINIHGFKTRVVIGYSPTNVSDSEAMKDDFYRNMKKACDLCPKHHKLIVAGDFNAETSLVHSRTEFDGKKIMLDEICNENGLRLKSFSRLYKFCMPQSFFDKPPINRLTWYSSDGKTTKILDYVMVQRFVNQYVSDCEVRTDFTFETDHRLLVTSLSTPRDKKSRWKPKNTPKSNPDIKLLLEHDYKAQFIQISSESLKRKQDVDKSAEAITTRLIDSLSEAAAVVLPKKDAPKVNQIWKNDAELNDLLQRRSIANTSSPEYKKLSKSIKSRVRKLKNEKMRKEAQDINTFATKREIESLYKSFKDDGSTFKQIRNKDGCDPQKLKQYFEKHFQKPKAQEDPIELTNAPEFITNLKRISNSTTIHSEAPNKTEIIDTLKRLKNGKSSNDVPPLYLKSAIESKEVIDELANLYKTIWMTEKLPQK